MRSRFFNWIGVGCVIGVFALATAGSEPIGPLSALVEDTTGGILAALTVETTGPVPIKGSVFATTNNAGCSTSLAKPGPYKRHTHTTSTNIDNR